MKPSDAILFIEMKPSNANFFIEMKPSDAMLFKNADFAVLFLQGCFVLVRPIQDGVICQAFG